ncbi:MAG: enoyl-CoA hydratase/isomerase family protein [Myxococcota bacterium]|jgi:enoyl-CoA hydratase|nr:enoyl-CoA hydratase/isomerase family protein [Myxococcota bacterium]
MSDITDTNSPLRFERQDRVATITINDAPMNRMTLEFMDCLEEVVDELAQDTGVGAVVITADGDKNFSVGMDLKQLPEGAKRKGSVEAVFDQRLRVLDQIETLDKPVIAVLFGYCLGGGLELPLACHFRLAAEEGAKIGLPEMDLGSVPAWGGSARLTRTVGRDRALDLVLRAKKIDGPEALRIGLVNEVWPNDQLQRAAQDLARELAAMPRTAVAGILRAIVNTDRASVAQGIADEREAVMATMGTKDQAEGMKAFLEKRKPVFNQD